MDAPSQSFDDRQLDDKTLLDKMQGFLPNSLFNSNFPDDNLQHVGFNGLSCPNRLAL